MQGLAPARETGLDFIRAMCLISMVLAHLAGGSFLTKFTHAALWFDGAMGFVLLSGLVTAMVQRRVSGDSDRWLGIRKLLRRAALVYACHIALCVISLAVNGTSGIPAGQLVLPVLLLRANPKEASILSIYVIFLVIAVFVVLLLRRRLEWVVITASVVLAIVGMLAPEFFALPKFPNAPGQFSWACWQLLFVIGMVLGWHWPRVREVVRQRWFIAAAIGFTVVIVAFARLGAPTLRNGFWRDVVAVAFDERALGFGCIALALAIVLGAYRPVTALVRRLPRLTAPLVRVGGFSLDAYVILGVVAMFAPLFWPIASDHPATTLLVVGVLVAAWVWATVRLGMRRHRLERTRPSPP